MIRRNRLYLVTAMINTILGEQPMTEIVTTPTAKAAVEFYKRKYYSFSKDIKRLEIDEITSMPGVTSIDNKVKYDHVYIVRLKYRSKDGKQMSVSGS